MGPLPPISDLSAKEALQVIRHDKKVLRGKLHFVLPTGLGHVEIVDNVSASELERAMKQTGMTD
jgi:3-dehydroquinate synthetase